MLDTTGVCPVCQSSATDLFVDRAGVSVHQNLMMPTQQAAETIARGQLSLRACRSCGFVHNAAFDPALLSYDASYDNTQNFSPTFVRHVDSLVEQLVRDRNVQNSRIVEVGCGKGGFISKLVEFPGANNRGVGFDPTYIGPDETLGGKLRFERRFYDEHASDVPADVVVCRHVIEHVPDPVSLLMSVRKALGASPQAKVFFETPCVRWILKERVVWDFFYEHCSLFTTESLATTFEAAGFVVEDVRHVFGGQYLFLEARLPGAGENITPRRNPLDIPPLAAEFKAHAETTCDRWKRELARMSARNRVILWGAGAKGVTFAQLADPKREFIDAVIDVNPSKQGKFLPGTGHPIIAPRALANRAATVVVLNPNYVREIEQMLAKERSPSPVIDLMRAA